MAAPQAPGSVGRDPAKVNLLSSMLYVLTPWARPPSPSRVMGNGPVRLTLLSMVLVALTGLLLSLWSSYVQSHTFIVYNLDEVAPELITPTPTWTKAFCWDVLVTIGPYPVWFAAVFLMHWLAVGWGRCPGRLICALSARFAVPYLLIWCVHVRYRWALGYALCGWPSLVAPFYEGPLPLLWYLGQVGLPVLGLGLLLIGLIRDARCLRSSE